MFKLGNFTIILYILIITIFRDSLGIIHGKSVFNAKMHPYLVRLKIFKYGQAVTCTGTLIKSRIVLTAAHCVENALFSNIVVYAGCITRTLCEHSQKSDVERIILPDKYHTRSDLDSDIAMLRLEKPFKITKYVKIIQLPKSADDYVIGMRASVFGWGICETGEMPDYLQKTKMQLISKEQCQQHVFTKPEYNDVKISDKMLCTFNRNASTICYGDSGGPLIYRNKIIGVLSGGGQGEVMLADNKTTCLPDMPAVFTKVINFVSWIHKCRHAKKCN